MSVSAGANPPSADSANTGPDTCTSDASDAANSSDAADSSDTAYAADSADAGSNARSNATYAGSNASGDASGNGERNAAGRDSANQQTFHYDSHMYLRRTSPVRKRCCEINVPRCRMRFHRRICGRSITPKNRICFARPRLEIEPLRERRRRRECVEGGTRA
jgi:hypothetical protein